MLLSLSRQGILLLIAIGFVLPGVLHTLSSPVILVLLFPLFLLLLVLAFLLLNVALGYFLDSTRPPTPNTLRTAARPLAFSTPAAWQAVLTRSQWSHKSPQSLSPLLPASPVISAALNDILIMIVRDFVLTWYKEISSSPSFPTAVSVTIHSSLQRLISRIESLDLPALIVKRILPKVTAHIEQFRQSEMALRGAGLERRLTQSEELDLLLASRYASRGGGKLHSAVDNLSSTFTKQTEEAHLRELIDKALPHILPEKEAGSKALKIVVREIMASSVLYPVMDMLSDPDFWNKSIDQVAGAAIRQQRLISKVRNVLEAQIPLPQSRVVGVAVPTSTDNTITIRTDPRQFESFLRSINRCSSLLDARRLKNDIMGEIRRTRTLLASHENEDWINGEKTEDIVAFLDRLYTAKRKVEKRIVILGGEEDALSSPSYSEPTASTRLTLRDILTNPSSLSYFMEFMDRRNRSLLVQFWLTVESFKNPLESVDSDSSGDDDDALTDPSLAATLKEDISMMNELYFSGTTPDPALSAVPQKHVNVIKSFGQDNNSPTLAAERRVRRSVMLAQRHVEKDMESDFEDFKRSELWFRVVRDVDLHPRRASTESWDHAREASSRLSSAHPFDTRPFAHRSESFPILSFPSHKRELSTKSDIQGPGVVSSPPSRASPSNLELLMSPAADNASSSSRAPLFDDPNDPAMKAQSQRMEAIHAALTDIIALDNQDTDSHARSLRDDISASTTLPSVRGDVEEGGSEDEREIHETQGGAHSSYQLAGPGDLQLSYEIARLSDKLDSLQSQDHMLDTLIKKAELTGDEQELRLLRKSKSSLTREILSDRTKISIVNSTTAEEDGKSVVRYLIEVQQLAPDGSFATGWVIARRYNEFFNMHNKLREKYALVRSLDFPGKRLVTSLNASFVDSRRVALEKYLQSLIAIPAVCESEELRTFLSRDSPFNAAASAAKGTTSAFPGKALVRSVYQSLAESIDDMFFGQSMLDVIIQRLTTQAAELAGIVGSGVHDEDLVAQALRASGKTTSEDSLLQLPGDLKPIDGETSTSTFSSPICDLILAVFELDKTNNWLRRQAIVIILQQVFGETIERKLRETVKVFTDEPHLMSYIQLFRDSLWPGGQLVSSNVPRTAEERLRTRDDANRKLSALIPDLAANMIGRSNARRGARRIFAVLQNRRLNQHLIYTIVDEVFLALFPEATS
ncbi:unnamed protein product [Somion occarium]|uniref:PhoX domain-containing protein n=1 Tax=Somion occarium TaxID=3059160 RepID=A0ABP1CIL1_9APHY